MGMAKHHIVQDKYLTQWRKTDTENQLNIYVISENKCIERGPGWRGFWKDDFNILDDDGEKLYLPENVTSVIDSRGIDAIRKIDEIYQSQLSAMDRSCVAFYVVLQYIRTPRHRDEMNKLIQTTTRHFMRKDDSTPEKVRMSKEEILKHKPINKQEEEALKKVGGMTEEEINKQIFEAIHSDDVKMRLTNTGHSKGILRVDRLAKKIFEMQWLFLIAQKGTSFVTSDNPCFTVSRSKIMNGLLSPNSTVFFPLRPDICICVKPAIKSQTEHFITLDKKQVREINLLTLAHSYECFVAKDKPQLDSLIKGFDHKSHRKSRDITISEIGDYTMFNAE